MSSNLLIKRALLSVSDKTGIVDLARTLVKYDCEIISSGGTKKFLEENGIHCTRIEDVTGNPEAFSGRMKTLSFQVSSALLYRRDSKDDINQAKELNIEPIDLVVCNLYPFEEVSKTSSDLDELIENIDIGGPTMLRASAKNYHHVASLCDTRDYESVINELNETKGEISFTTRKNLCAKTFAHTAHYDATIIEKLNPLLTDRPAAQVFKSGDLKELRYGENPHQKAFFLGDSSKWQTLQGKDLSYNNLLDADASFRCCFDLHTKFPTKKVAVIVKHSNPCGSAVTNGNLESLETAWSSDPISSFGGILCFNFEVDEAMATWLGDKFVEVVMAPSFSTEAQEVFAKKKNLRLVERSFDDSFLSEDMVKSVVGGFVVQKEDTEFCTKLNCVTKNNRNVDTDLLEFGVVLTKHFRSNAISLVTKKDDQLILVGAGMGNPNRLVSTTQAIEKAKENGYTDLSECVLISDAFFPFRDNVEVANSFGIKSIVQPGGSIKDKDVVAASDEFDMTMYFTGTRHFRH
ncbi:bifunctional phosphoribosylaminoimidazolecarboxamide formyltransferase/IMP cyclohydrolase [Halobacteriovorax marinus]|uniref:Bifunctional purine biosynthesis protein PurH n=1 Tax=Halobacteriovorax marinus TaxID=97084 RepID=A0A1Y5F8W7_9BACT|nr:bifunctional phosphoribosylaminoimidazolecarboxamide formyltransferase/IMP cyclohydrolase [Halobacteriovorax marinus]